MVLHGRTQGSPGLALDIFMAESPSHRHPSLRLRGFDYSSVAAYFITIVTQRKACLFGIVVHGEMQMSDAGLMVYKVWTELPASFERLDAINAVVMPNHFHGVLFLRPLRVDDKEEGEHGVRPYEGHAAKAQRVPPRGTQSGSLGRIVQSFKTFTTK